MKFNIEATARAFKLDPYNPLLSNQITQYIIAKFKSHIRNKSYTYKTYEDSDVDSIITDIFVRIQSNIDKWDETLCQFTTWLFSCIRNEIRSYFTNKEKHYSRYVNETQLAGGSEESEDWAEERVSNNIFADLAEEIQEKRKISIVKKGTLGIAMKNPPKNTISVWVLYNEEGTVIADRKMIRDFEKDMSLTLLDKTDIVDSLQMNSGKMNIRHRYNVNYIEQVVGYASENDDFEFAKLAIQKIIKSELDKKQKQFMIDYFTGNYKYTELGDKHAVPLSSVKNWVRNNKKIIKQNLNKQNTINEKVFASC